MRSLDLKRGEAAIRPARAESGFLREGLPYAAHRAGYGYKVRHICADI